MSKEHINMEYLAGEKVTDLAIVEASLQMTINKIEENKRPVADQLRNDLIRVTLHLNDRTRAEKLKELEKVRMDIRCWTPNEGKLAEAKAKEAAIMAELGMTLPTPETGPTPTESV